MSTTSDRQLSAAAPALDRPTPRPPRADVGRPRPARRSWRLSLRRDWQLYALAVLPVLFLVVFRYVPMLGNVIAFRQFRPGGSIFGEQWVGLRYVDMFIHDPTFWKVFTNTVI
ncbi:MAG TPA: sugar ABC transporter permease, partial [Isoptericola sp.]|nr:sugar ABC transporter permease [Isoptericola sp.]